jgi:soluble lytic murein transglycosylase-like protein
MFFSPVHAANVSTVKAAIVKHSIEMGVDPAITLSIAKTESGFRQEARSSHGAVGVFQLMPSTARRMGLNPYLLDDNIKAGVMYYKSMYKMFGSMELALAAYNAGPANVKKYQAIPPFSETKRFVAKIMTDYRQFKTTPDPAMIAAKKQNPTVAATKKATSTPAILAQTPASKPAPLPMSKFEQARNFNNKSSKGIPMEVDVKSQSVAI